MRMLWLSICCVVALGCGATPSLNGPDFEAAAAQAETSQTEAALAPADISRTDAIAQLSAQAFLSFGDASCVIDALHERVGVYNPNSAVAVEQGSQPELIEMCVNGGAPPAPVAAAEAESEDENGLVVREVQANPTPAPDLPPFELDEESAPSIAPGYAGAIRGTLTLQGTTFEYSTITPEGFEPGDSAPVFLVFPPGGQDIAMTSSITEFVYAAEALKRGWVVVSPAAPEGGTLWHEAENRKLIPDMVRWIAAWVDIEGKPHIGGMSNGGSSAFSIAIDHPALFQSLMAFPGAPVTDSEFFNLNKLRDLRVHMWVGSEDDVWLGSTENVTNVMRQAGVDADYTVEQGEPHVMESIQDGVAIFDELDAAR